ncbi:MAG: SRPBCC family protein [Verrucomicrobiota bacterium]
MTNTKTDSTEPLVMERTFHAPVARVWQALTQVDEMRQWYFDLENFEPRVGFEFQFVVEHEGMKYDHRCKVIAVIPHKKIAYTWRYEGHEGESLVTMELFDADGMTRLKLTHEGLATFPNHPAFAPENFFKGWTEILGSSLKGYLENPDHKLVVTRTFDAPRELVWESWTQPQAVSQWLGSGNGMTVESVVMDLREGGKFRIQQKMADGEFYTAAGIYLEVRAPERLVHSWDWEKDGSSADFEELEGNETRVTVEFHERGQGTHVVLTHERFASTKSRDGHEKGWNDWLAMLADFIAKA